MQKRERGKSGGSGGGSSQPSSNRERSFGSGSGRQNRCRDAAIPLSLLGPSLQVHPSFADQSNKRIVLALQSGIKNS